MITPSFGLTATERVRSVKVSITSGQNAEELVADIDDLSKRYLGAKSTVPSTDNEGGALVIGATYWDIPSDQMFTWNGTQWRPTYVIGNTVRTLTLATAGQTVLAAPTYIVGSHTIQVFVNGAKQILGTDYTETNQNTITMSAALAADDEVELIAQQAFAVDELRADLSSTAAGKGADLVAFKQSGTGAVARTAQDKMRETVSVKDFGVVGDGLTDDTAAFALALAAVAPGVKLRLLGLTIKISAQNIISSKSNFEIDGEGATIIAANGMTVGADKELLAFRSCSDFTVKNLTVNGNRSNRTPAEVAAHNIEIRSCQRFVFERVRSINAVVDGFILNTSTATDASTFVRYGYFFECTADNAYRQGMSIINAYNIVVAGGAFTNTTGTSPQSGIDIEANIGAATPGNAYILIHGARFSGNVGRGIITSAVSTGVDIWIDGCSFDTNTDCAISAAATGTVISKCSFRGHTASVQGIVRFPSASPAVTSGVIRDCTFSGNTAAAPCIYVHSSCSNVSILDNKILDHANAGGISQFGTGTIVRGNYVSSAGSVGITMIGTDPVCVGNIVTGCANRGIYTVGSLRPYIAENTVRDILSVLGGYIQSDDADAVIERNHCISVTAATTTYGVYVGANSAALSVSDNVFVNLHSTNPIFVTGSGSIKKRSNNLGGTRNPGDMGWSKFLKTDYSTVANLPDASTYSVCRTVVTDATTTTFGAVVAGGGSNVVPVYSDGINWRIG